MTTKVYNRPRYQHVYARYHKARRVLTAAIAAAALVAATAAAGKILSGA